MKPLQLHSSIRWTNSECTMTRTHTYGVLLLSLIFAECFLARVPCVCCPGPPRMRWGKTWSRSIMPSGYTFSHACSCVRIQIYSRHNPHWQTPGPGYWTRRESWVLRACLCVRVCECNWGVWGILGWRFFSAGGCVHFHVYVFFSFSLSPRRRGRVSPNQTH